MKQIAPAQNTLYSYFLIIIFTTCIMLTSNAQNEEHPYETVDKVCTKCSCIEKKDNQPSKFYVLNCMSKNFSQILDGYPDSFDLTDKGTHLDMSFSGNKITILNKLPSTDVLVSFSCRHCGMNKISTDAFMNASHIFKLDLSWNELTDLTPEMFHGPYNDHVYDPIGLVDLDLSHNSLEILQHNLFEHMPHIKVLKLSHNRLNISHLQTIAALESLKNIERLNLAYNGIETLPLDIFNKHLIDLNIYGNKFETVPESLVQGGASLQSLNIGGNLIKTIDDKSFSGMHSLKYLHMSDLRNLQDIHQMAFSHLTELESLYSFNNTNVTSMNIGSLNSSKLRVLDISNCSIETLELTYSDSNNADDNDTTTLLFSNLISLKIENNPWHCNCILFKSLQKLMKFDENDFQSENTARCSTPYELASDLLVDITIDTLCLVKNNKKPREEVYDPPAFLRPRSLLFSLLSILIVVLIGLCIGFAIVLIKKKLKQNEIGFSSPIRYTTVRNSTISVA